MAIRANRSETMTHTHADTHLIETPSQLEQLCGQLANAPWLALDTEFHRERTYHPRLCLIQVATPELSACIDAIRLPQLDPFLALLYRPDVTKVFHSASQDLEVLYRLRAEPLAPLFDTQIAATLLGHRDQIGYGALVEAMLGLRLPKGHTRTDWRRRPLSRAQLDYAADDVIHLARLYPLLRAQLQDRERLGWLEEDFRHLAEVARYQPHPHTAWQRIKNGASLGGRQRAALRALAAWRENTACRLDLPRGWLMRDDLLLEIARQLPDSPAALERLAAGHRSAVHKHRDALLELLDAARSGETDDGEPAPPRRLEPEEKARVEQLLERLEARCRAAELDPQAVAGRRELGRLIQGERQLRLLRGWRRRFIGASLLNAVESGEV